jgi:hypothetical protein
MLCLMEVEEFVASETTTIAPVGPDTGTGTGTEDKDGKDSGGGNICCPLCKWMPRSFDRWMCKCRHVWNTFDTGGVYPKCLYQWKITSCPKCKQWSHTPIGIQNSRGGALYSWCH